MKITRYLFLLDVLTSDQVETLKMLVSPVEKFFREKVDSKKIDETKEIPPEVLNGLKELVQTIILNLIRSFLI